MNNKNNQLKKLILIYYDKIALGGCQIDVKKLEVLI